LFFTGSVILKRKGKSVQREDIAKFRQRLIDILAKEDARQRFGELERLAKEVGAGYVHTEIATTTTEKTEKGETRYIYQNPISESELVLNINNSLQTETMIDMCKIAARNFWITLLAATAAVLSALAACGWQPLKWWVMLWIKCFLNG
jgi:hypothetical protein